MQAVFVALIAILGTLGGAVVSGLLQQKNATRSADTARSEQRRQERLTAYVEFGQTLSQLRGAGITRWNTRAELGREDSKYGEAKAEEYRARQVARGALIRVQLLTDNDELVINAQEALAVTIALMEADSEDDLAKRAEKARASADTFIRSAARNGGLRS
jgi:hypothetical protein